MLILGIIDAILSWPIWLQVLLAVVGAIAAYWFVRQFVWKTYEIQREDADVALLNEQLGPLGYTCERERSAIPGENNVSFHTAQGIYEPILRIFNGSNGVLSHFLMGIDHTRGMHVDLRREDANAVLEGAYFNHGARALLDVVSSEAWYALLDAVDTAHPEHRQRLSIDLDSDLDVRWGRGYSDATSPIPPAFDDFVLLVEAFERVVEVIEGASTSAHTPHELLERSREASIPWGSTLAARILLCAHHGTPEAEAARDEWNDDPSRSPAGLTLEWSLDERDVARLDDVLDARLHAIERTPFELVGPLCVDLCSRYDAGSIAARIAQTREDSYLDERVTSLALRLTHTALSERFERDEALELIDALAPLLGQGLYIRSFDVLFGTPDSMSEEAARRLLSCRLPASLYLAHTSELARVWSDELEERLAHVLTHDGLTAEVFLAIVEAARDRESVRLYAACREARDRLKGEGSLLSNAELDVALRDYTSVIERFREAGGQLSVVMDSSDGGLEVVRAASGALSERAEDEVALDLDVPEHAEESR